MIFTFSVCSQAESAFGEFFFRELSALAGAITITCLMVCPQLGLEAILSFKFQTQCSQLPCKYLRWS